MMPSNRIDEEVETLWLHLYGSIVIILGIIKGFVVDIRIERSDYSLTRLICFASALFFEDNSLSIGIVVGDVLFILNRHFSLLFICIKDDSTRSHDSIT